MADVGFSEVMSAAGVILSAYPWSLGETIAFFLGAQHVVGLLFSKQYDKARDEAYKVGLSLVTTAMDDKDKRDRVIQAAYSVLPAYIKKMTTAKQLEGIVDEVWATKTKSEAKRLGLTKASVESIAIKASDGRE